MGLLRRLALIDLDGVSANPMSTSPTEAEEPEIGRWLTFACRPHEGTTRVDGRQLHELCSKPSA